MNKSDHPTAPPEREGKVGKYTLECDKCGHLASEFDEEGDFCDQPIGESVVDRCNGCFEKQARYSEPSEYLTENPDSIAY